MAFEVLCPTTRERMHTCYMCTPGDTVANAKGMGSIGAGQLENREAQVGFFAGLLDSFCPFCLVGLSENPCTVD